MSPFMKKFNQLSNQQFNYSVLAKINSTRIDQKTPRENSGEMRNPEIKAKATFSQCVFDKLNNR
jgi:hypothetical protein